MMTVAPVVQRWKADARRWNWRRVFGNNSSGASSAYRQTFSDGSPSGHLQLSIIRLIRARLAPPIEVSHEALSLSALLHANEAEPSSLKRHKFQISGSGRPCRKRDGIGYSLLFGSTVRIVNDRAGLLLTSLSSHLPCIDGNGHDLRFVSGMRSKTDKPDGCQSRWISAPKASMSPRSSRLPNPPLPLSDGCGPFFSIQLR